MLIFGLLVTWTKMAFFTKLIFVQQINFIIIIITFIFLFALRWSNMWAEKTRPWWWHSKAKPSPLRKKCKHGALSRLTVSRSVQSGKAYGGCDRWHPPPRTLETAESRDGGFESHNNSILKSSFEGKWIKTRSMTFVPVTARWFQCCPHYEL